VRLQLVDVGQSQQMCALGTAVSNVHDEVGREFVLNVQAPLLGIGYVHIRIGSTQRSERSCAGSAASSRIAERCIGNHYVLKERRINKDVLLEYAYQRCSVSGAISSANRRLPGLAGIPGRHDTRSKVAGARRV